MSAKIRERVVRWLNDSPRVTATDHTDFRTALTHIGGLLRALGVAEAERRSALAEVERLARERDAALANTHTMVAALDDLASANADRDRLAAALAEVREAAGSVFPVAPLDHGHIIPPEHARLFRALAATPADLATAHDARVRAEAYAEVTRAVEHRGPAILVVASDVQAVIDAVDDHHDRVRAEVLRTVAPRVGKECRSGHEAEVWLCAEAERIGGGR